MFKKVLFFMFISVFFVSGCGDREYEQKKSLIVAVNRFYDAILVQDLDRIYEYLPDEFKKIRDKEDFRKFIDQYSKQNIMGAFGLVSIYKFEIKKIESVGKNSFEATVIIHEKKTRKKMQDIMTWQMSDAGWENVSYKKVVNNLIKDVIGTNEKVEEKILLLNDCKTQMKYLAMLVWEFCNEKKLSLKEFRDVRPDLWINLLDQNGKFINETKPQCSSGGTYSVVFDAEQGNIVVKCSHHTSVAVPYKFVTPKEK